MLNESEVHGLRDRILKERQSRLELLEEVPEDVGPAIKLNALQMFNESCRQLELVEWILEMEN